MRADSLAFARFRTEIVARWGDYRGTTKKDWVEYSDDFFTRTVVDFEEGTATIDVLVPTSVDSAAVIGRLRTAVATLILNPGKTMDYKVLDQSPRPLGQRAILADQLAGPDGELVTSETAETFARNIVSPEAVTSTTVISGDGIARIKVSVTTSLVPDHLRVRAKKYIETVRRHADRYGLDTRLILALIHTESYFNPKARSPVPAFGLMQLVPSSGGRDAYEFVTGKAADPLPNYLYNPDLNIELGCAYLSVIKDRYLAGIENLQSRLYCTICAYNTGAGNVSRAFSGTNRVKLAIPKINTMSPDQVLSVLKADLPYKETRRYIENVLNRVKYYNEWKN
ncbi:MAG: DUF3393 domain-containing protein [Bacteroidales bacterium]|nr:DUF3393 domain-containing protein [Candidatus Latescibacterota bacterium]